MKRWLRRIAWGFVALLVIAMGVGGVIEASARRQAAIDFPPLGKMVSIGERSLQLDCRGSGSPTVVFESGLGTFGSLSWSKVHSEVAGFSRACAYSRAGILWSDPDDGVRDGEAVAQDLHKLLNAAGEKPPFVIVAHSLGGPYAMIYTKHFGAEVAGLVFVDTSHPDQVRRTSKDGSATSEISIAYKIARHLIWTGIGRLVPFPNDGSERDRTLVAYSPPSGGAMMQEQEVIDQTFREAGTFRDLGDRPLFVLTGMKRYTERELNAPNVSPELREDRRRRGRIWKELQDEQAAWSSVSEHQLVEDAAHNIQDERPDAVIAAVKWVLNRVRGTEPGP